MPAFSWAGPFTAGEIFERSSRPRSESRPAKLSYEQRRQLRYIDSIAKKYFEEKNKPLFVGDCVVHYARRRFGRRRQMYLCGLRLTSSRQAPYVVVAWQIHEPGKKTPSPVLLCTDEPLRKDCYKGCVPIEEYVARQGMTPAALRDLRHEVQITIATAR